MDKTNDFLSPLSCLDIYLPFYDKLLARLRNEKNLKRLESILRHDLEKTIKEPVLSWDYDTLVLTLPNRNIIWVSDGFSSMTGYTKSFAIGRTPSFLQGERTSIRTKRRLTEELKTKNSFSGSLLNYKKNGEAYLCDIQILPIYNNKNTLTNYLALEKALPKKV